MHPALPDRGNLVRWSRWLVQVVLALSLMQAVTNMHAGGVSSGELSPSSIVLSVDGLYLVSELGSFSHPACFAPEQLKTFLHYRYGHKAQGSSDLAATCEADVWAIAAILLHAFTETAPCQGHSAASLTDSMSRGEIPILRDLEASELPAVVKHFLRQCVRVDPAARISASALCEQMEAFAEAECAPALDRYKARRAAAKKVCSKCISPCHVEACRKAQFTWWRHAPG
jgi:serine/threonine protein kinase